jgi:hypothetical protein
MGLRQRHQIKAGFALLNARFILVPVAGKRLPGPYVRELLLKVKDRSRTGQSVSPLCIKPALETQLLTDIPLSVSRSDIPRADVLTSHCSGIDPHGLCMRYTRVINHPQGIRISADLAASEEETEKLRQP